MKIALTYAVPGRSGGSSSSMPGALVEALEACGAKVEAIDAAGDAARVAERLLSARPALVIDASGQPGVELLVDGLGLPRAGSDARASALCRDRHLARLAAWGQGVSTARWTLCEKPGAFRAPTGRHPVRLVPRTGPHDLLEAGHDAQGLGPAVAEALEAHPAGVLLEELPPGGDVVAHFVEGRVVLPAGIDGPEHGRLEALVRRAVAALGLRGAASLRARACPPRGPLFLDADPSPIIVPGSPLVLAAGGLEALFVALLRSSCERLGLPRPGAAGGAKAQEAEAGAGEEARAERAARETVEPPGERAPEPPAEGRQGSGLRVGFTFNVKRISPSGGDDSEAEFDGPDTIGAIEAAIARLGHRVVRLEATPELPSRLTPGSVDVVFNIAEGSRGKGREGQVPALLDLLGIEYTGSEPPALALTLDKAMAKRVVRDAGVLTPAFCTLGDADGPLPAGITYPAIVKPVAEGSSKGVLGTSVAEDEASLRELVRAVVDRYHQEALVEAYLPGREFTVALLGERGERALPAMEICFTDQSAARKVYTFEHKQAFCEAIRYDAPARVDEALGRELERVARASFRALGCRDVARIDLRLDAEGRVHFVECNPLPGLSPGWSDICLAAAGAGIAYDQIIAAILAPALARLAAREEGG